MDFEIVKSDWSSFQKAQTDVNKLEKKVNQAIKDNLSEILGEESLVLPDSTGKVTITLPTIKQNRIRFKDSSKYGTDKSEGGMVRGTQFPLNSKDKYPFSIPGPSTEKGEDWYEANVDILQVEESLFEELELPKLEKKDTKEIMQTDVEFDQIHHIGILGNLDKKRTFKQALLRSALEGKPTVSDFTKDDLRFKSWREEEKPFSNAVIIALMDTSGSMGIWEKYIARSFFFWTKRFLEKNYENVKIVYIAHHVEAKVVTEDEFFNKGESGGTICSSALRKALEVIEEQFSSDYNVYCFHATDGDNLTSDNRRCVRLVEQLREKCVKVGVLEVNQYNRHSTLATAYKRIPETVLDRYVVKQRADIYNSLKKFFGKGRAV